MEYNFDVREYNTFGLSCVANKFLRIREEKDLQTLAKLYQVEDIFLLGMGANTIFSTNKCEKTIVKIENLGKQIIMEDDVSILIEVSAGECWDDFVEWATKQKFSGLENLSAIPSSIGATPVQNIGAYGMEVKNIIEYVVCFDLKGEKWIRFENKECNFGYRESIFKHQEGNFIIWRVGFRLKKNFTPNIEYKDIKKAIENNNITSLSPSIIARLVKQIRKEKLPDYKVLGNVGSFFKNPIISNKHYAELVKVYPNIVAFDEKESKKISAAWLIEYCGYKGKRIGNVGMSSNQALIMVNYGGANGEEVLFLAKEIQEKVKQNFDINLEIEANII